MKLPKKKENTKKIIVILGMPRSGTTLAGAIFDAHSETCVCFEPWNRQKKNPPASTITPDDLAKHYNIPGKSTDTFVIKETAISPQALEWVAKFIEHNQSQYDIRIVWTIRNYRHTYLSLIEKGREWWGNKNMAVNTGTYNRWVKRASVSTDTIMQMYLKNPGIIYAYEKLVEQPEEIIRAIMSACGLSYSSKLVEYFKYSTGKNIRGDLNLQNQLSSINEDHITEREKQWEKYKDQLLIAENNMLREDLDNLASYVYHSNYISGTEKLTTLIEHVMHQIYQKPNKGID